MGLRSRSGRAWPESEDALLKTLIRSGKDALTIALYLNRTTRAIRRRAEILRISWKANRGSRTPICVASRRSTHPPWTIQEDNLIRDMILAGCNESIIATELCRTISAVRNRAYKLKLSLKSLIA